VNLVTLLGLSATLLGFYMTYRQIQINFERIETYQELYDGIFQILAEIKTRSAKEFYFYGSTLLPGSLASADTASVTTLREGIANLFTAAEKVNGTKIRIFLPSAARCKELFDTYRNSQPVDSALIHPGADTEKVVESEYVRSENLYKYITSEAVKEGGKVWQISRAVEEASGKALPFEAEFFYSNGKRSVHVLALHYSPKVQSDGSPKVLSPALIGVNTKDASITKALKHRFYNMRENYSEKSNSSEKNYSLGEK